MGIFVHVCACAWMDISMCVFACVDGCLSVCLCVSVCGHHGRGPHYLAGSHTNIATDQWGQLAYLFLFPQHFNELVMGRTDQLP